MENESTFVDLGFADAKLPPGTHICQIYRDEDERNESLMRFLLAGLKAGECNACFSDNILEKDLDRFFDEHGISLSQVENEGAFSLSRTSDVYFRGGEFNPETMLEMLSGYHEKSTEDGFPAARVIGEMSAAIDHVPGGSRLLEYESRVSLLLKDHPLTAMCQYNAHSFDGATIMDVLKVHPMMVVSGAVVRNPFYIPPEEYLKKFCNDK